MALYNVNNGKTMLEGGTQFLDVYLRLHETTKTETEQKAAIISRARSTFL